MHKYGGLILLALIILTLSFTPHASAQTQTTPVTFPRNLSLGATGVDVSFLQFLLINKGFLDTALPTKYFGMLTFNALAEWQASVGLPASGYFGPLSRAAIENADVAEVSASSTSATSSALSPSIPSPLPSMAAGFDRNLTVGDTGNDVTQLQALLIQKGFLAVPNPTGYFGAMTSAALAKWQGTVGLPSTGYFGPLSRAEVATGTVEAPNTISMSNGTSPQTQNSTMAPAPAPATAPVVNYAGGGGGGGGGGNSNPSPSVIPDTTPPTIFITLASTTATANASDNIGVTKVEFYIDGSLQATITAAPYSFTFDPTRLTPGVHNLSAKAYDAAGNSGTSPDIPITINNNDNVAGTPDTTPPTVPTGLTLTVVSSTQINLSWTASTDNVGVTGYHLHRNNAYLGATNGGTTYADTGLTPNTTYTYTVIAVDAAGNLSGQSLSASAKTPAAAANQTPTVPGNLTITGVTTSTVSLSWSASTETGGSVTGYKIYRGGTQTGTSAGTSFTDAGLAPGTAYAYAVAAYDATGNVSAKSATMNATTNSIATSTPDTTPPTTPTGLTLTVVSSTQINLSWTASTDNVGVTGYHLHRNNAYLGATSGGTTYADTGLTPNTTYTYTVIAVDAAGNLSGQSLSASAKTPAAAATVNPNYNFGISVGETLMGLPAATLNQKLDDIASLGVGWLRVDIEWDHVQPSNSSNYNWSFIDPFVAAASAHHLKILGILDYTPSWAASPSCTTGTDRCAPADPAQYAAYAKAAAAHFTPAGITDWEIWNEPNLASSWEPGADPAAYETFLQAAYTAIKSVNPSAVVLTGGMGPSGLTANGDFAPIDFLTGIYAAGGEPYFDAVGDHPYSYPAMPSYVKPWNAWSQMASITPSLRSVMAANGDSGKQIWITEYGAPTNGPGILETSATDTQFIGSPDHVTEALQAQMMVDAVNSVKASSWAGPFFWYSYQDLGTSASDRENFFGLLRYDGSTKPAYQTYGSLLQ